MKKLFFSTLIALAGACNPYDYQHGEFNAGPVDPANFPADYLGTGADPPGAGFRGGRGKFNETSAFVNGLPAGYYKFPFSATQLAAGVDSLRLVDNGSPYKPLPSAAAIPVPNAYVFDPAPPNPFPVRQTCMPPPNYHYNQQTDDLRLDEQDNIFTLLPLATEKPGVASTFDYVPVVAEVPVSAAGAACQSFKSQATLLQATSNLPQSGNYLLWAIIDPAAGVYRVGQSSTYNLSDGGVNPAFASGVGVQKYGWYAHYYLAYIDGGYIPTLTATVNEGGRMKQVLRMKTQRLYFPRTISSASARCGSTNCTPGQVCAGTPPTCQTCQASGARACPTGFTCGTSAPVTGVCTASGAQGAGYDVLQARRGETGYSPVCEAWTYTANTSGATPRPLAISELPTSEAAINALPAAAPAQVTTGTTRYIYCPQVD
jgi:hypothetical protein